MNIITAKQFTIKTTFKETRVNIIKQFYSTLQNKNKHLSTFPSVFKVNL